MDISETIEAYDLKVDGCRPLTEVMKVCGYLRSRSFLDLGPRSFTFENRNLLFSETTWPFLIKFCMSTITYMKMNFFNKMLVT